MFALALVDLTKPPAKYFNPAAAKQTSELLTDPTSF